MCLLSYVITEKYPTVHAFAFKSLGLIKKGFYFFIFQSSKHYVSCLECSIYINIFFFCFKNKIIVFFFSDDNRRKKHKTPSLCVTLVIRHVLSILFSKYLKSIMLTTFQFSSINKSIVLPDISII